MKLVTLFLIVLSLLDTTSGQEPVFFYARDQQKVRADLYLQDNSYPFIVLVYQKGSDHSDYDEIARRLLNLSYNCLVVGLRDNSGAPQTNPVIIPESAEEHTSEHLFAALYDIEAAITYAQSLNNRPVILLGSSFSASLCMYAAAGNLQVKAVIALSPGEYLRPFVSVSEIVKDIRQSIFITVTSNEYPYVCDMMALMPSDQVTVFRPEKGEGLHGALALWNSDEEVSREYWFALMMFFKKIENNSTM